MAKRKSFRISFRFILFVAAIFAFAAVIALCVTLRGHGTDTVRTGSMVTRLSVPGVILRDETVVSTDKYEKIIFNVTEGQMVANDTLIATVFKRGYQDESMVAILNLQKEIYAAQKKMMNPEDPTMASINAAIDSLETRIRNVARGYEDADMLELEMKLKQLQQNRIDYLASVITPDPNLTALYNQLQDQQAAMKNWTTDIINTAGGGLVSFYFDGYEQVLNLANLSSVNVSLVSSLIKNGNTADTVESNTQAELYRLVAPNHWFLAYVSAADDPLRVVAGEQYDVTFDDYSTAIYRAIAREPVVYAESSAENDENAAYESGVVNLLEFDQVGIGNFVGIRTVNATVTKTVQQGLEVDADSIQCENGFPNVYVKSDGSLIKVQVDVLAMDEKKALIRAKNGNAVLAAGQKLAKP